MIMHNILTISYKIYKIIAFSLGTLVIVIYILSLYMDHNDYIGEKTYLTGNIQHIDMNTGTIRIVDNQGNILATNQLADVDWHSHINDSCAADIQRLLTYAQQKTITFNGTYTEGLQIHIQPVSTEPYTTTGNLNMGIQAIIDHHHPPTTAWWNNRDQ